jgi:hypothetical protein
MQGCGRAVRVNLEDSSVPTSVAAVLPCLNVNVKLIDFGAVSEKNGLNDDKEETTRQERHRGWC